MLPLKARAQQPTLVGAEYFFNADPGFGNGANIPITSGPDVSFQTQVSTTGLGLGFHRLSVRFLDNIGNWGQVSTRTLWLGRVTALTAVPIVAAEYFFNADPGFGNGTAVAVSSGLTVDFTTVVSTAGLSEGFHRLSFRVRDQNDIWSLIQTRIFWIGRTNPDQISPIVAAEYFINTDPGFGNGTALAVTQGPNPQVEGVINVGDLPRGFHRLSVRFRNQANEWGLVTTKLFFVENEGFTDPALVDFIEYFFDDDDPGLGQAIEIPLDEAASNIDLDELIEVAALEEGEHTISLRIKNNKGLWSIVETREFTVGEPTPGDPPIPDLETLPDLNAECLVDFSALDVPTATAADGSSLTGTTDESIFPISQQGTTTITWTYTDENGLETTQTQNIVIQDITPPTISLPAEIIVEANPGQCFATGVNLGTPITDDNCGVGSVVNNAPSSFAVGLNEVLWTVTDVGGNTAQFLQLVTVQDTQLPVIPEIADLIVNTDEDACSATGVNLTTPSASDNCGISSLTNDAPEVFPLGPTLVTWTAVDPSGNSSTRSFNVIVNDTQNPIIIAPANVTVLIGEDEDVATNVELGTPEMSDNCSIASLTNNAPSEFPLGQNTVIWTIIDG
ncbi:MAG: HYR domain-containing protein, partial [Mongoliibacter sp.]